VPELTSPTSRLRPSWLASNREWAGQHQDGSGLHEDDDTKTVQGFAAWVGRLTREGDVSVPLAPGRVHATYWWITEGEEYLGAITLRHTLNDFLLDAGGHIGYSVRPSARGRGLAAWAVGEVLGRARSLGLGRVLITCADDNLASARTIERNGGVLEDVRDTVLGRTRRYWIEL
jgi:predicted acetyltransferase